MFQWISEGLSNVGMGGWVTILLFLALLIVFVVRNTKPEE